MVIDGGFQRDHPDYPASRSIYGGSDWGRPNPFDCGGRPCPWHGTHVTQAAMALPDNNQGVAGPAGPVAELVAVQVPGDFFEFLRFVVTTLAASAIERPRIINISGAGAIPAVPGALLEAALAPLLLAIQTNPLGPIFVTAAGNAGANVDAEDCFIVCWEEDLWAPCELSGFICVGGMGWNTTAKAERSNWGSDRDSSSVDIYGPFTIWAGPDPSTGEVHKVSGTSLSSPFVAGVAALIWAANPLLPRQVVESILLDTAHNGGVHDGGGHQRRVNAFGAVSRALGNVPPFVRIESPTEGRVFSWRFPVSLNATTYDPDTPGTPALAWQSSLNGSLGSGTSVTVNNLNLGSHRITATATSGGQTASDSVNITVRNDPPSVQIVEPDTSNTLCTNSPITFRATVSDPNNPPSNPFPTGNVVWRVGSTSFGTGLTATRTFNTAGTYTITVQATDDAPAPHTLSATDTRTITVVACTNNPPTANITNPPSDLVVDFNGSDANGWYYQITLQGNATDPEDGTLSGASLVWSTNRADVQPGGPSTGEQTLGTGNSLTVRLYTTCELPYFGTVEHRITLTATDSAGNRVVRTRLITVRTLC